MQTKRGIIVGAFGVVMALAFLANAVAAAPPQASLRVYADDRLWASFSATDLNPGPGVSLDKIYVFPGTSLIPVSAVGPGSPGYTGGRWEVHAVTFMDGATPTQFTNGQQVLTAAGLGQLSISGPVTYFECPLVPL